MKAIILKDFGGVENLLIEDVPVPDIAENEVLVKVKALGINPVDYKTRQGKGQAQKLREYNPMILGWDISGTVEETGIASTHFKKGDEVFGMVNFPGHGKAYAEYVAAPESDLALKPANISHGEASAAALAALTAWQILKGKFRIKPGDKILIHAAAGGVGHYAVQMAAWLGAKVTGTSSGINKEFVLNLGASGHIDYGKLPFEDFLHDQDFVLDSIGGEYIDRSLKVLKPGGTIITLPSGTSEGVEEKARARGMSGGRFIVHSNGENMKEIADLLEKGFIRSFISKSYRFDEMQSAHLQLETSRTIGKIVVTL